MSATGSAPTDVFQTGLSPRMGEIVKATSSSETVCARIAQRLADNVGSWRYNMWFGKSVRMRYSDQHRRLDIDVPNQFVADRLGRKFRDELHEAASNELGETVNLAFRIDPGSFP